MSAVIKISLIYVISLVVTGLLMTFVPAIPFPDVSGDMLWRVTGGVRLHLPLGTALIITAGFTLFLWAGGRL